MLTMRKPCSYNPQDERPEGVGDLEGVGGDDRLHEGGAEEVRLQPDGERLGGAAGHSILRLRQGKSPQPYFLQMSGICYQLPRG